ncbi:hypothetical protein JCM8547_003361 [Rhodosporidiobolus lusitaniae]
MPAPLPRELIEQIISDLEGDPKTLSRFCLAGKAYLAFSRAVLYRHVTVEIFEMESDYGEDDDEEEQIYSLASKSGDRLRRFGDMPHLAQLVRHVTLQHTISCPHTGYSTSPDDALEWIMEILPRFESFKLIEERETSANDWLCATWLPKKDRARPSRLELVDFIPATWTLIRGLRDNLRHAAFPYGFAGWENHRVSKPMRHLKLASLELRWESEREEEKYRQTFDFLTTSSRNTLGTLST